MVNAQHSIFTISWTKVFEKMINLCKHVATSALFKTLNEKYLN